MAFVKIVKGNKSLTVSEGAFKSNFSKTGWRLEGVKAGSVANLKNEEPATEEEMSEVEEVEEKDEWDEADEELEDKSVDDMDMKELQAKAKELNINIKNLNTIGSLRKAITACLVSNPAWSLHNAIGLVIVIIELFICVTKLIYKHQWSNKKEMRPINWRISCYGCC